MTADKDFFGRSAVAFDVFEGPGDRGGRILDISGRLGLGAQAIIHRHHRESIPLQGLWNGSASTGQATAMEPDNCGEILQALGMVQVQLAP